MQEEDHHGEKAVVNAAAWGESRGCSALFHWHSLCISDPGPAVQRAEHLATYFLITRFAVTQCQHTHGYWVIACLQQSLQAVVVNFDANLVGLRMTEDVGETHP